MSYFSVSAFASLLLVLAPPCASAHAENIDNQTASFLQPWLALTVT